MSKTHVNMKSFTLVMTKSQTPVLFRQDNLDKYYNFEVIASNARIYSSLVLNPGQDALSQPPEQVFVLGDDQDYADAETRYLGNGVILSYSAADKTIEISTSITGLPAVFLYQNDQYTVLASDIHNIASVPGLHLEFDPHGLSDLARIGHPINHRTLFKGLTIVPAGTRLTLVKGNEFKTTDHWHQTQDPVFNSWPEYIEAQVNATKATVHRLDLSGSFLSLTAGLDTRAILALLIQEGARVPAFTLTGEHISLDAMRAKQLCNAYGMSHKSVSIDSAFINELPTLATEASRLSGGLESFGQAFEIYLYESVPDNLGARISGNLGNQIGRSGTEGTGMRNVSLDILSPEYRTSSNASNGQHWFNDIFPDQQMMHPLFLIQNENLYASVGNYCIGNHFAKQQTPYADRTVINQKMRQPPLPHHNKKQEAIWQIKMRDLRHRILGQPVEYSFQRRIVKDTGGFVSTCPVNWGWRAKGGVSLNGLMFGGMAMADAILSSRLGRHPLSTKLLKATGIYGLSSFQEINMLENSRVKQFIGDTLLSTNFKQSGILDNKLLSHTVDSDFSDPRHRPTLEFAMDVALAQQNFLSPRK